MTLVRIVRISAQCVRAYVSESCRAHRAHHLYRCARCVRTDEWAGALVRNRKTPVRTVRTGAEYHEEVAA
jgi:hypothetical protein